MFCLSLIVINRNRTMPTSLNIQPQFVSRSRGQKRIDLRAALETAPCPQTIHELTFSELARAYLATHYNGADMQMRKWNSTIYPYK